MDLSGFANTADGVCGIDGAGRIALWNRAAERILGYPAAEVTGKSCCEVFDGHHDGDEIRCFRNCIVRARLRPGELVEHFPLVTRTRTGAPIRLDMSVIVLPGRTPLHGGTVHLFREQARANEPDRPVASSPGVRSTNANGDPGLTRRELEVFRLLIVGDTTGSIAARLRISRATVRNHVQGVLRKLGVHSRLEAVARASHRDPLG